MGYWWHNLTLLLQPVLDLILLFLIIVVKKSRIPETPTLSVCADISTYTMKSFFFKHFFALVGPFLAIFV